ncbi:MAG: hypothetical protein ACTHW1_06795 [Ancrocorticia sp.]|uniref:hypothetical protein n=1 Tax=Ancrocorticia sp. TaxID=2593684 RepID=UPI003F90B75A
MDTNDSPVSPQNSTGDDFGGEQPHEEAGRPTEQLGEPDGELTGQVGSPTEQVGHPTEHIGQPVDQAAGYPTEQYQAAQYEAGPGPYAGVPPAYAPRGQWPGQPHGAPPAGQGLPPAAQSAQLGPQGVRPAVQGPPPPQPPYGYYQPPPNQPPQGNRTKKRRVKMWLTIIGLLLFLILAAFVTVQVMNAGRTPEASVKEYLGYIAAGDATSATEMVDPGIPNGSRLLLTDETLEVSTAKIEVIDVTSSSNFDGSEYYVTATYSLDGERLDRVFTVLPGDNEFLFLNTWEIQDAMVLRANVESDWYPELSVGGTTIPVGWSYGDSEVQDQFIYPGIYEVTAPGDAGSYVSAEPQILKVTGAGDGANSIYVQPEITDSLKDLVLEEAVAQVNSCASVPGNMDSECPYSVGATNLQSLEVTSLPDGFNDVSLDIFETNEAVITIKENPSSFNENPEPEEIEFTLHGNVILEYGGEPEITIEGSYESW